MKCPKCGSDRLIKKGKAPDGTKRYRCKECGFQPREDKLVTATKEHWDEKQGSAVGSIVTAVKPKTIEDATKLFNVDTYLWEAERMVINSWDVSSKINNQMKTATNYQVKVWFKKRVKGITPEEIAETFKKHIMNSIKPIAKDMNFVKNNNKDVLLEITIFDLHLGKLCWGKETGENYDMKIASDRFLFSLQDLLNKAKGFKFTRIVFAIGNDFFHADTPENTTTAGTSVDVDARWQKRFDVGCKLLVQGIDILRSHTPVDIICIPGNHDWQTMFMAGEYLKAWYKDCETVQIMNEPTSRKYYKWEDVLIGYTHGNKEKPIDLFSLMANESSEHWHSCKTKEWHLGHLHHEMAKDYNGVTVRWLKSPGSIDSWHSGKGFVGSIKGSQAFLYGKNEGMIANFYSNIRE